MSLSQMTKLVYTLGLNAWEIFKTMSEKQNLLWQYLLIIVSFTSIELESIVSEMKLLLILLTAMAQLIESF